MDKRKVLGNSGENLVADCLKKRKFKIVAQNYQTRVGEVDIIASKKDVLAFVEVKTRKKSYFPISLVVTPLKQKKIIATAKQFVAKNNVGDKVIRFDVATIIWNDDICEIEYIEDAFRSLF